MKEFPHLKLPFRVDGGYQFHGGGGGDKGQQTLINLENREGHGSFLKSRIEKLHDRWEKLAASRKEEGRPLPNEHDIPVFLKIDTAVFPNIDSLVNWGVEVISEEEDGFVIGASTDKLEAFKKNVEGFLKKEGTYKDTASKIWDFSPNSAWKKRLLKGDLAKVWDTLEEEKRYTIELSVSCYVPNIKKYPELKDFDSEEKFSAKVEEFRLHEQQLSIDRDDKQMRRESEIESYLKTYGGELLDIWDNQVDAVFFKIAINGAGLRDLVFTYQYLFEVKVESKFALGDEEVGMEEFELETLSPADDAVRICVIDSGIQEEHRLISKAVDGTSSRSYVTGDPEIADFVKNSGHGTKVAGAILYPYQIPAQGEYQLETIIQNARILDRNNRISQNEFAPKLMEKIVGDYAGTKIFNLSVCDDDAYLGTHMPVLAASIDKLIHEKDIIFVIAAGNLYEDNHDALNPGIRQHLDAGLSYPDFLNLDYSKIANPGTSYFAITVGSISAADYEDDDYKSIAGNQFVSPFSRTGLGMWGCIKPDVVEFGGDLVKNKLSTHFRKEKTVSPNLVNSTLHGAAATGRDINGTSFSAPKVSYILGRLQTEHPDESAQMYRALLVQSARLPAHCFENPTLNDFRHYGYGVPDLNRATNNSERRITFIQNGRLEPRKADIYHLKIPTELRGEGKEFKLLVEVTLAFTSKTRVTRKGSHSYLANWLEWKSSKYNENFDSFRTRTLSYLENDGNDAADINQDEGQGAIQWVLRENPKWANNDINRNKSTVQKSWAVISPHQFNSEFSLAVIGHAGWDKNMENKTDYALCVSFEVMDAELNIYSLLAEAQVEVAQELEIEL